MLRNSSGDGARVVAFHFSQIVTRLSSTNTRRAGLEAGDCGTEPFGSAGSILPSPVRKSATMLPVTAGLPDSRTVQSEQRRLSLGHRRGENRQRHAVLPHLCLLISNGATIDLVLGHVEKRRRYSSDQQLNGAQRRRDTTRAVQLSACRPITETISPGAIGRG